MKEAANENTGPAPQPHADRCDMCFLILTGVLFLFSTANLSVLLLLLREPLR